MVSPSDKLFKRVPVWPLGIRCEATGYLTSSIATGFWITS
jgi:hypothetical protein